MQFIQDTHPEAFPQLLERLPPELLQYIIELHFFSKPLGSHYALHQLRLLLHETNPYLRIRREIEHFLRSLRIREIIRTRWNLYLNYNDAVSNQHEIPLYPERQRDLATWSLTECTDCFYFMLDRWAIRPSYYNNHGYSFFALASHLENKELLCRLVSSAEPKELLKFLSTGLEDHTTIFQQTVTDAKVFQICWDRLESAPDLDLSLTLRVKHIYTVCKYVTVDLANRLLARGIDISMGLATGNGNLTAWHAVAEFHPDPKSIFEWLHIHALLPQELRPAVLLRATQSDRVEAAIWLIDHSNDSIEYRPAAIEAAKRQTDESATILDGIVQRTSLAQSRDRSLFPLQDLVVEIVSGACTKSRDLFMKKEVLCERQARFAEQHAEVYKSELTILEKRAILKIQKSLVCNSDWFLDMALVLAAREANLHNLAGLLDHLMDKE
ncbi:hypothetical protein NUU61_009356 [Penicillium alfredii]|uniref:Uncharacterized protein n=1 Tax=Penicillium alfredii TaxID=1506179 RepID=A0A9W9EMV8_9EURO|nr:uncharacterized protein NUU61_009356 [Penicillium alfredii]KAJ5084777.1 hypothetical protein NUU61_009356 [Penicillium alfredii]